ncbi:MAG TPA: efflux RND transporter periplasmic adaptor subunit [Flavobacteriales bacterium]|nr:efflux RND transporter periplasmic adaptor subunit [Flavobacteriales bacterium]
MKTKIFITLLTFLLLSCSDSENQQSEKTIQNEKNPNVKVVNPQQRSFTSTLHIIGNALPNKQVNIHAMEGGFLSDLKKDIGDKVQKGDVLAVLNNPELTRELEINKVAKQVAEANYLRFKKVIAKTPELTTLQEFEKVEATYLMANAKYKATANRDSLLTIRAPFSGVITTRNVELGALIQSGINSSNATALFEIMDMKIIRLTIALPETEVDNISKGMQAEISFTELPGEQFSAQVSRMANAIDNRTKTMQVQLDIPNRNGKIKAGMYANVAIQLQSTGDKISLPNEVLIAIKSEFFILQVKDGIVKRTLIKKGLSNTQFFEVLSNEITENSKIIIEGKAMVKAGMQVKAVN